MLTITNEDCKRASPHYKAFAFTPLRKPSRPQNSFDGRQKFACGIHFPGRHVVGAAEMLRPQHGDATSKNQEALV